MLMGCLMPLAAPKAAWDAFINFGADSSSKLVVAGESNDATYPGRGGWIQISEINEGILNTVSIGSSISGAGAGKASFTPFELHKTVDAASPALFSACGKGLHFNMVQLALRNSAGVYYTAVMRHVFVQSVDWSGASGDDAPAETVSLVYGQWEWTYKAPTGPGKPVKPQTVNWSVMGNVGGIGLLPGLNPNASSPAYSLSPGLGLKIKVSEIATDPNGSALRVTSLGPSSQGATLSADKDYIFYAPANNHADSFAYTVDNELGGSATGTITVQFVQPGGILPKISSAGGWVTLNFAGIPGFVYDVQYTSDLSAGWVTVTTFTTPDDGLFTFTEKSRSNPAFYRLVQH
jgi:type VI secretion system secreted protein Hcp